MEKFQITRRKFEEELYISYWYNRASVINNYYFIFYLDEASTVCRERCYKRSPEKLKLRGVRAEEMLFR